MIPVNENRISRWPKRNWIGHPNGPSHKDYKNQLTIFKVPSLLRGVKLSPRVRKRPNPKGNKKKKQYTVHSSTGTQIRVCTYPKDKTQGFCNSIKLSTKEQKKEIRERCEKRHQKRKRIDRKEKGTKQNKPCYYVFYYDDSTVHSTAQHKHTIHRICMHICIYRNTPKVRPLFKES
mmetsp:Transcript_10217/g.11732  ORF Transcript_10217/g.11732 Transcript_10217/m.11732 type:complete len:176 (-) Transcript_10217:26-553(-)